MSGQVTRALPKAQRLRVERKTREMQRATGYAPVGTLSSSPFLTYTPYPSVSLFLAGPFEMRVHVE